MPKSVRNFLADFGYFAILNKLAFKNPVHFKKLYFCPKLWFMKKKIPDFPTFIQTLGNANLSKGIFSGIIGFLNYLTFLILDALTNKLKYVGPKQ